MILKIYSNFPKMHFKSTRKFFFELRIINEVCLAFEIRISTLEKIINGNCIKRYFEKYTKTALTSSKVTLKNLLYVYYMVTQNSWFIWSWLLFGILKKKRKLKTKKKVGRIVVDAR